MKLGPNGAQVNGHAMFSDVETEIGVDEGATEHDGMRAFHSERGRNSWAKFRSNFLNITEGVSASLKVWTKHVQAKIRTWLVCRWRSSSNVGSKADTYIHTYMHTYITKHDNTLQTVIHTYVRTYRHAYLHTYICKYMPTYIHAYIHIYKHTSIHPYVHTYIHTCMRAYIHTDRQTDTHTDISATTSGVKPTGPQYNVLAVACLALGPARVHLIYILYTS